MGYHINNPVIDPWKMPEVPVVHYDRNDLAACHKRIAELEDAVEPLLPYAKCDNYRLEGMFAKTTPDAQRKYEEFQRATIYMDLGVFQRLEHLMKDRIDGA